jgi:lipid-A-disaccharide synthase
MQTAPRIFIIAGEASGDIIGADLLRQITQNYPDALIAGIGGEQMLQNGLARSLFPISDLSVMGLFEVIKHLPCLLSRLEQTRQAIKTFRPDLLLTIDSPDFGLRIAKWVKANMPSVKKVHVVAPTVWAWRAGRAKKIAQFLDGLLCLFPFEPPYFTPHGLKAWFMGHPLTKIITPLTADKKRNFLQTYNLDEQRPIVCLLPGSRTHEVESLLPIFIATAKNLLRDNPQLQIIIPAMTHLAAPVQQMCTQENLRVTLITLQSDKYTAMQLSRVALHASGTVALELALCNTPMVTAYKANALTGWIGRRVLTIKYLNLVNLLCDQLVVPEILQGDCTAENITPIMHSLLNDPVAADKQRQSFARVHKELQPEEPAVNFLSQFI